MIRPVTVAIDVPHGRLAVYDFLDVMANHESFTDHAMTNWRLSGPARGVGSKVRVTVIAAGKSDEVDIEVVDAREGSMIRECNVGAKGRRRAYGTYELTDLSDGGTHVQFTYSWETAPLSERLFAPVLRALLRRINERAMQRLALELSKIAS